MSNFLIILKRSHFHVNVPIYEAISLNLTSTTSDFTGEKVELIIIFDDMLSMINKLLTRL